MDSAKKRLLCCYLVAMLKHLRLTKQRYRSQESWMICPKKKSWQRHKDCLKYKDSNVLLDSAQINEGGNFKLNHRLVENLLEAEDLLEANMEEALEGNNDLTALKKKRYKRWKRLKSLSFKRKNLNSTQIILKGALAVLQLKNVTKT